MTEKKKTSPLRKPIFFVLISTFALSLIVLSVALFVALWSYDIGDAAWRHNGGGVTQNTLGLVGAWYSDFSFSLLGKPSYLVPFALFVIALHAWFEKGVDRELLSWRLFMLLTAILSACVLWAKHDPQAINSVAQTGGGALGTWLVMGLEKSVKSVPVIMGFSLLIFIASLSLLANVPWLKLIDWLGASICRLFILFVGLFSKRPTKKPQPLAPEQTRETEPTRVAQPNIDNEKPATPTPAIGKPKFTINRYAGEEHHGEVGTSNEALLKETFGIPPKKAKPAPQLNITNDRDEQSSREIASHTNAHLGSLTAGLRASADEKDTPFSTPPNREDGGIDFNPVADNRPERAPDSASSSDADAQEPTFFDFERIKKPSVKVPEATRHHHESPPTRLASLSAKKETTPTAVAHNVTAVDTPPSDNQSVDNASSIWDENHFVDNQQPSDTFDGVPDLIEKDDHEKTTPKPVAPQPQIPESKATIGQAYDMQAATDSAIVTQHQLPSVDLLDSPPPQNNAYTEDALAEMAGVLETTLKQFNVDATVMHVSPGPVITRFEIDLAPGIQAKKITNLSQDLARALAVSRVRVEEVITGSSYVGLEVPNQSRETVYFKEVVCSKPFQNATSPLTLSLGADTSGKPVVADLMKMPHVLVAGTTGSGKSVCINVMLLSMLYKTSPKDLRLILVDPKMLEMSMYEDIPHLLTPVITDMNEAENALTWAVGEMERRYQLMAALKVRKIDAFNALVDSANAKGQPIKDPLWEPNEGVGYTHHPQLERLPFIVIVIDELADMMMVVGKQVEQLIARLTQKARAAGIHVVLATQRPSTDVLTGLIKANVPTRIAFQVSSGTDSRVIIDSVGAEKLLGHGDMLYVPPGASHPQRLHGAFVGDAETDRITDFLRTMGAPDYIEGITRKQAPETLGAFGAAEVAEEKVDADPLYGEAIEIVLQTGKASISSVQRQLRIGYNRAARMIEDMQEQGIVSEPINGVRKILAPPPPQDRD